MIPKFKFWDKDEQYFIKDATIVLNQDGSVEGLEYYHSKLQRSVYNDISYYELIQSTGLKDKNGVEIFEGDVVNREKGLGIPHEIIFKNCEFKLVTPHSEESLGKTRKGGLIIVGNKYEHPNLLEE